MESESDRATPKKPAPSAESHTPSPIVLSGAIGLSYVLVAQYKSAYLGHFGVRSVLLEVGPRDLLMGVPLLLFILFVTAKITIGTPEKWRQSFYWDATIYGTLMIFLLVNAKLSLLAWLGMALPLLLILCWGAYCERKRELAGEKKALAGGAHYIEFTEYLIGEKPTMLFGILFVIFALGYALAAISGTLMARRQATYLTWPASGSTDICLAVGTFQGHLIGAHYDSETKSLVGRVSLLPLSQAHNLKNEEIGPLKYWWLTTSSN